MLNPRIFLSLAGVIFLAHGSFAQTACKPPDIIFNKEAFNLFDENQEMALGKIMAEQLERNYRIVNDQEASRYVEEIGKRLAAHLPPTDIKFQFFVVDLPEVNAFSAAGGRIYISRKMIAFARNEDELAGVIGHELGHSVVHHVAIDISNLLDKMLGVQKLGDEQDIFAKYNQLLDKWKTKKARGKRNHEDEQQFEADRVGVYAAIASGYSADAYTALLDRLLQTKGKTGNPFSELFGTIKPDEKRLREAIKAVSNVPSECADKRGKISDSDFHNWQSYVTSISTFPKEEKLKFLIAKKTLAPFLQSDINHLQFSPDGNFIIAQDEAGINILKKDPFSFDFRIEAKYAKFARFTPDSKNVVFQTYGLRVEKWNLDEKRPVVAREVYSLRECWQTALSPNGDYLICYSKQASLDIIDVQTSEVVYRKERFYLPHIYEYYAWVYSDEPEVTPLALEFSPNGRYFLGSRVHRYSLSFEHPTEPRLVWGYADLTQNAHFAYDLQEKKVVKMGGSLEDKLSMPFTFYSNDKIIGQDPDDSAKAGIFSFPDGERTDTFGLHANRYWKPSQGNMVVVWPTATAPVGIYDVQNKKFVLANKTPAIDISGDYFVSENTSGKLGLFKIDVNGKQVTPVGLVQMPKANLGDLRTVDISPDLSWLTLSASSRGGVWNVADGGRTFYSRGFRGSFVDDDNKVYVDFPKQDQQERMMAVMDPGAKTLQGLDPIDTRNTKQFGKFILRFRSSASDKLESKEKEDQEKKKATDTRDKDSRADKATKDNIPGLEMNSYSSADATFELYDARSRKMLWTKTFSDEVPSYVFDPHGDDLALIWRVAATAAKKEIAESPSLLQKVADLDNKNGAFLVEVVDAGAGNVKKSLIVEIGEDTSIRKIGVTGDKLIVADTNNRILVYSLETGDVLWRFFGTYAVIDPKRPLIAIGNISGQLTLYNLNSGQKVDQLLFSSAIDFVRFSADGERLFVLTNNQNYYVINARGFPIS